MKTKDSEAMQLRDLISDTESLLAAKERSLLTANRLCASDLNILGRLDKKGSKPVNQIAPKVGLTSGSMTSAVQRLRKRGLVQTSKGKKDGRKVWVEITAEGQTVLNEFSKGRHKEIEPIMASLSPREEKVLTALLKKIRKASRKK